MEESLNEILNQHPELTKNPQKVKEMPIAIAFKVAELVKNSLHSISNPIHTQLAIESVSIYNRFKKNQIAFNQLKTQILSQKLIWIIPSEFELIQTQYFDQNKTIDQMDVNETSIWKEIEKIREKELLNYLNLYLSTNEITLNEEFRKLYPQMTIFLKKLVLDQIGFDMFRKVNVQINQLFALAKIDKNHPLAKETNFDSKQVIFAYINMNRMEVPKTPRFGSIFDAYDVNHHRVIGMYHKLIKSQVPLHFKQKNIIVSCDVWVGNIVCEA